MKIGFIPGALDTLSGKHLPHLIHMRENVAALRTKADITVLTAKRLSSAYVKLQNAWLYQMINREYGYAIRKFLHCLFFFAVYLELRRNIEEERYDLFLIRYSLSNLFICRYLHLKGCRIMLEVHGLAHVEERDYGQTRIPSCYFVALALLERKMLNWADHIIVVSEPIRNALEGYGIGRNRVHVIPNAVDTEKFQYLINRGDIVKEHKLENKIVIGFVGSFARYHGFDFLLDIVESLRRKYDNIILLLVGRNFDGTGNPMEEAVARDLSHLCVFAGEVAHSKVPAYVASMDIAMVPDFNEYGSPMKLFEYMAMGKAIVAVDVPPIRDIVRDGETGVLFERGNVAQAVKGIERLIEDEQFRHEMGQRAYVEVTGSYTWEKNADRIIEIAESLVGQ